MLSSLRHDSVSPPAQKGKKTNGKRRKKRGREKKAAKPTGREVSFYRTSILVFSITVYVAGTGEPRDDAALSAGHGEILTAPVCAPSPFAPYHTYAYFIDVTLVPGSIFVYLCTYLCIYKHKFRSCVSTSINVHTHTNRTCVRTCMCINMCMYIYAESSYSYPQSEYFPSHIRERCWVSTILKRSRPAATGTHRNEFRNAVCERTSSQTGVHGRAPVRLPSPSDLSSCTGRLSLQLSLSPSRVPSFRDGPN